MKQIKVVNSQPITKVDENFFTGPNNYAALNTLKDLGVKVIISVLPKEHSLITDLKRFERRKGVEVIYPFIRPIVFSGRFVPGLSFPDGFYYKSFNHAKALAAQALRISKTRKVAVVCVAGGFSGDNVLKEYLKLKRRALLSSRRRVLTRKVRISKVKRKILVRRHK